MSRPLLLVALAFPLFAAPARAQMPEKFEPVVSKGLAWLTKQQRGDGSWTAPNQQYPVAVTGIAGMAFLAEGSTTTTGKYKDNLRRAVDFLLERCQADGRFGRPDEPSEAGRYMFGQGYAVLFLASACPGEEDRGRRAKLKDALNRGVRFIGQAQSSRGGWFYTSAKDGGDNDEGAATLAQIQALRAARLAGIPLPPGVLDKGRKYLQMGTTAMGGVIYSSRPGVAPVGGERPALTVGAVACAYSREEFPEPIVKKWIAYCRRSVPMPGALRGAYDEYTVSYQAQAIYALGDDGYAKLFPGAAAGETLRWSDYRATLFDTLQKSQQADGSWAGGGGFSVGTVYATALYLTALQLDRDAVPVFQR